MFDEYKICDFCFEGPHRCICAKVDKFFEDSDSLRPFDGPKPLAPVINLAEYRLNKNRKSIA